MPGSIPTGATRAGVERNMRETIAVHLDGLRGDDQPVARPSTSAAYVEVAA